MKRSVQVTVFGQKYTVKSDASPEEISRVATFVNSRIDELSLLAGSSDSLNVAVLALLNVSGAYLKLRDGEDSAAEVRLRSLSERIEQACPVMQNE